MRTGTLAALAVLASALAPATADAAPTCDLSAGLLEVTLGTDDDVRVQPAGSEIVVYVNGIPIRCLGATPTVTNTNAVSIRNAPGNAGGRVTLDDVERFAPGMTAEAGDDEIEFFVNLNDGPVSGLKIVTGEPSGGHVVFGVGGINPNAHDAEQQPDDDITYNGVRLLTGVGGAGPDLLSARGGRGTGAPLSARIVFDGVGGNDVVHGGNGADRLFGSAGEDELVGFGGDDDVDGGLGENALLSGGDGDDSLVPGSAADPVDGGPGADVLHYVNVARGVAVSLAGTSVETLYGTQFDDVLSGDDGPNEINGAAGADRIDGAGGADVLVGGVGDDMLNVLDGAADTAGCGPDVDAVTADVQGVDRITDCETVLFARPLDPGGPGPGAPTPPGAGGPGSPTPAPPGGGPGPSPPRPAAFGARTRVSLKLVRRRVAAGRPVLVRIANANAFAVSGRLAVRAGRRRLAPRPFTLAASSSVTVRLRLPRALQRTRPLTLSAAATVRDPAGNARTVRATLRVARTARGR